MFHYREHLRYFAIWQSYSLRKCYSRRNFQEVARDLTLHRNFYWSCMDCYKNDGYVTYVSDKKNRYLHSISQLYGTSLTDFINITNGDSRKINLRDLSTWRIQSYINWIGGPVLGYIHGNINNTNNAHQDAWYPKHPRVKTICNWMKVWSFSIH